MTNETKEYIIWAWKGDYLNLGAGAEIGIYVDNKKTFLGAKHWDVDKALEQKGKLELYHTDPVTLVREKIINKWGR